MLRLALIVSLALIASCTHSPAPAAPTSPTARNNAGCDYAKSVSKNGVCLIQANDVHMHSLAGNELVVADTAIVDFGRVLAYCWSGPGAGSDCSVLANMNPQPPQQQPDAQKPTADADAKHGPDSAGGKPDAKADAKKSDQKKPDAKK